MFGLNENTQYYVCQRYVRMNMGINGLYQIVRTEMELPPLGGAVFIFFSKNPLWWPSCCPGPTPCTR